jgi:hypothetical protein
MPMPGPSDVLKNEVFGRFVTTFIPGSLSVFPYAFVLFSYFPVLGQIWAGNWLAISAAFVTVAIANGLIIESLGGWVESEVWDKVLDKKDKEHLKRWEKYLRLRTDAEVVGQSYLSTRVMFMKFDLGVAIATPIAWFGFLWLQLKHELMCWPAFFVLSSVLGVLVIYLLWDSYKCAELLGRVRQLLIEDSAPEERNNRGRKSSKRRPTRGG